jgi:Na+/phosphate symporter
MKVKFSQIKSDNEQSCEQECIMFLRQSYTEIERALKNQQYPSFIDYLHDIEQFKQIFEENGPPGSNRKEILLEFCLKACMESSEFFLANATNEINLQRTLAEETVRKLQQEIKDMKAESKERLESIESKVRKSEIEKAELAAREQSSKEALHQLTSEKNQMEAEMNQKLIDLKRQMES